MSRIHDALRRGRAPAQSSPGGRTAHADAVLAALGYKPDQPRRPHTGIIIGLVLFAALAASVWWWLPTTGRPKPASVSPKASIQTRPPPPKAATAPPRQPPPQAVTTAQTEPPPPPRPRPAAASITASDVNADAATHTTARLPAAPKRPFTTPGASVVPAAPKPSALPETPAVTGNDFKLALYYQRTGDFEQALVHYKTVLQRDEMNADVHNNVGNLYMSKALYEDAAREFRRVVAIEPKYVAAHVNLSAALYQLKRYDESAAEARAAIRLDGRNADAYVNLALAQAAAGQASDARATLTRALEIDKHNAAAHYNLALQYENAGEFALALDHYRAFLQYAGPEQAGYAADVRSRVQALERK